MLRCAEQVPDRDSFFLLKSSTNRCKEEIRKVASERIKILLNIVLHANNDKATLSQLEDLLEPRMSASLTDMSRLDPKNRRPNEEFTVMLKRKLRLPLWPQQRLRCACGKTMDAFGDHVMSCTKHPKTTMHNSIRNGLWRTLKKACITVKLISSETMVEREPPNVLPELPRLRPFDISIMFDHMLDEDAWRSDLKMLGLDITMVPPAKELTSSTSNSQTARSKELYMRLREGEKKKFCRDGKTDKRTGVTYSGEEIMHLMERDNLALIPVAVTPHGHTSPLFNRLLYGHDTEPHTTFKNKPCANTCEESARSTKVPHNMLGRANYIWRTTHPQEFYGGSYKAMDPRTHFDQTLGLIMSTSITSHLLRAHKRVRTLQPTRMTPDDDTVSTTSVTTATTSPTHTEQEPRSTTEGQHNPSQDTLGEHFPSPSNPPSYAQHHKRDTQPMDFLVTTGEN